MSPTFHSQIKAEVLLLLKEVIHNELAHEVRVERVIYDLGASELRENEPGRGWRVGQTKAKGKIDHTGSLRYDQIKWMFAHFVIQSGPSLSVIRHFAEN